MTTEPPITSPGTLETDAVLVRTLRTEDLDAVVAIDAAAVGRRRREYFQPRLCLERAIDPTQPED